MAIESSQSRSVVDKAREAMVTVLEKWPLECVFPVIDYLRSTLAMPARYVLLHIFRIYYIYKYNPIGGDLHVAPVLLVMILGS
jgi:hypothetical protein